MNDSTKITCPSCQASNPYANRFCNSCGARMSGLDTTRHDSSPYQPPASGELAAVGGFIFAGFWKRFFAYLIDVIVFAILIAIIFFTVFSSNIELASLNDESSDKVLLLYSLYYLLWWLYFSIQESSSAQATLGKRALGIKVTDLDGQQISFIHATGRQWAGILSSLSFSIGYLLAAFTGKKQALHDMIAKTLVVNNNFGPQQVQAAVQSPPTGMSAGAIFGIIFLVLLVPISGIIAAIALPAYQDYSIRAQVDESYQLAEPGKLAIAQYAKETGYWPNNFQKANWTPPEKENYRYELQKNGMIKISYTQPEPIETAYLILVPKLSTSGDYIWQCDSKYFKQQYLPRACRSTD